MFQAKVDKGNFRIGDREIIARHGGDNQKQK